MGLGEVSQKDMGKGTHHQTLPLDFRQFIIWQITSSVCSIQHILTVSFFNEQQVTACVSILKSVLSFSLLYREMEFPVVLSV